PRPRRSPPRGDPRSSVQPGVGPLGSRLPSDDQGRTWPHHWPAPAGTGAVARVEPCLLSGELHGPPGLCARAVGAGCRRYPVVGLRPGRHGDHRPHNDQTPLSCGSRRGGPSPRPPRPPPYVSPTSPDPFPPTRSTALLS